MLKKTVKYICNHNKLFHRVIYEPYADYCEKRWQRIADETNYGLKDAAHCLQGVKHEPGVNFWFLLEQGHNNIGDIGIGIGEKSFFETYFPDIPKHFVYESVFSRYKREICGQIHLGDVIVLRGGGSIGNTIIHEKHREWIIKKFKRNLVVSMPQTMCFPDTPKGKKERLRASRIYSGNTNLLLLAREKKSYIDMKVFFREHAYVLYLMLL